MFEVFLSFTSSLKQTLSITFVSVISIFFLIGCLDLKETKLQIDGVDFVIEEFKQHLKNRNLIKFHSYDTIESISKLRNLDVKINKDLLNSFINKDKLPWPGFFTGHELKNSTYKLLSYEVLNDIYFCNISGIEMSVPYNNNFFNFENNNLTLLDSSLTI